MERKTFERNLTFQVYRSGLFPLVVKIPISGCFCQLSSVFHLQRHANKVRLFSWLSAFLMVRRIFFIKWSHKVPITNDSFLDLMKTALDMRDSLSNFTYRRASFIYRVLSRDCPWPCHSSDTAEYWLNQEKPRILSSVAVYDWNTVETFRLEYCRNVSH